MAEYSFVTTWRIAAPIEKAWDAIYHPDRWPSWWKGVVRVEELAKGNERGLGAIHRYTWKSKLPYLLIFDMHVTRVEPPIALEGRAQGELEGTGRWELSERDGVTTIHYYWNVRTTKPWMNLLAPLARPVFAWNHDVIMGWGGEGLARLLGARLVDSGDQV